MKYDRRLRLICIDVDFFLEVIKGLVNLTTVCLPTSNEIPDDAQVVRVYEDYERQCWCLVVHSTQFNLVPGGMPIPLMDRCYSMAEFRRKPITDTFEKVT